MKSELHVPSDLGFIKIVEQWLFGCLELHLGTSVDWTQQSSRLRLALVEAYSNAVRHAHKEKSNLPILLRLELKDRDLSIEIWDYGEGYDQSTYFPPNPIAKQEGGYGWLIMNRLMDKVEYQLQINGANCLKLETTLPELFPHGNREQGTGNMI
jgi:serine/threonine-protein kinase RsbW